MSRNWWPLIRFILQKAFSRHFDVPVTCEALELLFGTSFQQLESLATHTQKLGAQLAPPAFQGLRLACCVADMHDSRLMIFSVLLVIRITKIDGVPCGENIELVQTRTPCILLSQEIVPQISDQCFKFYFSFWILQPPYRILFLWTDLFPGLSRLALVSRIIRAIFLIFVLVSWIIQAEISYFHWCFLDYPGECFLDYPGEIDHGCFLDYPGESFLDYPSKFVNSGGLTQCSNYNFLVS